MSGVNHAERPAKRFGRPPDPAAPETPPADDQTLPPGPADWFDMADAPRDGTRVVVTSDLADEVLVVWRSTRAFDPELGRFADRAYWTRWAGDGRPIDFEPLGWRAPS